MLTQTGNVYGFSRAYMLTRNDFYLQMARAALNFMYQNAWDSLHHGWYSELDMYGNVIQPQADKSAFDQHYALLGISSYYEATGDTLAWNQLHRGYAFNESILWDNRTQYFGYYDYGNYSWSTTADKSFNATVDAITTHLLSFYLLTDDPTYPKPLPSLWTVPNPAPSAKNISFIRLTLLETNHK